MLNKPNIYIQVQSSYIKYQSLPEENRFIFTYKISIRNLGRMHVQLISRYWLITNSNGKRTEVLGKGILGKNPIIKSKTEYCYTSGAIIETPMGTMEGYYIMLDNNDNFFHVDIPVFRLAIPTLIN